MGHTNEGYLNALRKLKIWYYKHIFIYLCVFNRINFISSYLIHTQITIYRHCHNSSSVRGLNVCFLTIIWQIYVLEKLVAWNSFLQIILLSKTRVVSFRGMLSVMYDERNQRRYSPVFSLVIPRVHSWFYTGHIWEVFLKRNPIRNLSSVL